MKIGIGGMTAGIILLMAGSAAAGDISGLGDVRSFQHRSQDDISAGRLSLQDILAHGELLFDTPLTRLNGQGRPATTGGSARRVPNQPEFIRTSAPDSSSCFGPLENP